ncbi:MAG: hypothetical protein ACQXXG_09695 [Candidatus Bathyarchaeia archaeon]
MSRSRSIPKLPSAEEFRKNVENLIEKYGIVDCIYRQCLEEFSKLEIGQLREEHQTRIIEPFLLTWGRMGRVLGHEGVKAICKKLVALREKIEPVRCKNILSEDINSLRNLIIDLYDDIRKTPFLSKKGKQKEVGPTAASKVLHLTCPDLFVMWDTAIRNKGYGKYNGDGKDYYEFLCEMKDIAKALENTIRELQQRYGERVTRLLDQYNWMEFTEKINS